MNSTSFGSRLVRIAARSPARSSTGPEVCFRLTPISRAMMCASVVLPRPGGPNSSTWSSASARARAACTKISSWPRAFSWPTYSASVAGRSERSICCSCCEEGLAEMRRSVSTLMGAKNTPKKKRAAAAALSCCNFSLLEAPEDADAHHVDIRLADVIAADLLVLLPLGAHAEVLGEVVLHADAVGEVAVRVRGGRGRVRDVGVRLVHADLAEQRELVGHRQDADGDQVPGLGLDGEGAEARLVAVHLAELAVAEFHREVAVDLVAAE